MADRPPLGVVLDTLDGLNLPSRTDTSTLLHKEWQHFSLLDQLNGLHAIFNLNLAGTGGRESNAGAARVLTAIREQDRGWHGDIDTIPGGELGLERHCIDMRMGSTVLSFDGTAYHLRVANRRGTIEGELAFRPLAAPLMMRNNTPVGRGHINWLVVPRLTVDGRLRIEDRAYQVEGSQGYHDHNWGSWSWGDDFAWEWGFAIGEATDSESSRALVFDRTTDRSRLAVKELTMALWEDDALSRVFSRREISVRAEGFLRCGRLLKLPRIMALIEPQRTHDIPEVFHMNARADSDHLEAEFRAEHAMQVVVPNDVDLQNTIINEVIGRFTAHGRVKGQPVTFSGLSFFEFLT
jgi:hypothetical protein